MQGTNYLLHNSLVDVEIIGHLTVSVLRRLWGLGAHDRQIVSSIWWWF